jgi:hypothetical protein
LITICVAVALRFTGCCCCFLLSLFVWTFVYRLYVRFCCVVVAFAVVVVDLQFVPFHIRCWLFVAVVVTFVRCCCCCYRCSLVDFCFVCVRLHVRSLLVRFDSFGSLRLLLIRCCCSYVVRLIPGRFPLPFVHIHVRFVTLRVTFTVIRCLRYHVYVVVTVVVRFVTFTYTFVSLLRLTTFVCCFVRLLLFYVVGYAFVAFYVPLAFRLLVVVPLFGCRSRLFSFRSFTVYVRLPVVTLI